MHYKIQYKTDVPDSVWIIQNVGFTRVLLYCSLYVQYFIENSLCWCLFWKLLYYKFALQVSNETIALILDPEDIYSIAQNLRSYKFNKILLIGAIGLDKNLLKLWKNIFTGGYLIEPQMAELPDFTNYLLSELQVIISFHHIFT